MHPNSKPKRNVIQAIDFNTCNTTEAFIAQLSIPDWIVMYPKEAYVVYSVQAQKRKVKHS